MSGDMDEPEHDLAPDVDDPRDPDRQVADIVAMVLARRLAGEPAPAALWGALVDSSAPVSADIQAVVAESCHLDLQWSETAVALHRLARRWRSPLLATLADTYSAGGGALDLGYLHAVATGTGVEHSVPPQLALKRLKHPRHGSPWDDDEDRRLLGAFRAGATVDVLGEQHQRDENAIRARLLKLGAVEGGESAGWETNTVAVWAATGVDRLPTDEEKAERADWIAATFTPLDEVDADLAEELAGALVDEFLSHGGLSARRKDEALASVELRRGVTPNGRQILGADLPLGVGRLEYVWDGSHAAACQIARDIGEVAGINVSHERDVFGPTGWEPEYDGDSP